MKVRKIFWLFLFLLIVDMIVIFMFSSQNSDNSSQISQEITTGLIEKTGKKTEDLTAVEFVNVEHIVRKAAHIALYTVLGLFSSLSLKAGTRKNAKWQLYVFALAFCILYVASDEYHQTFVKGRDGSVIDVLIDSCGSLAGIAGVWLASKKFSFGIK